MDYRCPGCGANVGKRRWDAVVTRMEVECPACKRVLVLNVHRAERAVVLLVCGAVALLAATGFWLESRGLLLCAFGAVMGGSLAIPFLERIYLRSWRRYVVR